MSVGTNVNTEVEGPNLPDEFIKVIPHPHSLDPTSTIIPLTSFPSLSIDVSGPIFQPRSDPWPWAPFQTLADFEYTETAIQGLLSKALINKQLAGINSKWAVGSRLTIKNYNDMEKALAKARKHTVQVRTILHCIYSHELNLVLNSLQAPQSLALWTENFIPSPLNIEIHGSGFSRSFRMNHWPPCICGIRYKNIIAVVTMRSAFTMNPTQQIPGGP